MAEQPTEFAGLAALVTGGASGIGLATARLLASRGARVAVLDRDQPSDDTGDGLYPVLADVTDDAAVRAAVAQAGQALAGLDILVNNAGIGAAGTVEDNDDDEWHRVLDVNVLGIVRTTRAALPLLRQAVREHGRAAAARPVLREQGGGLRADAGHGGRLRGRGDQGQLREPGHGRHSVGGPAARRRARPGGRTGRAR